MVPGERAEPAGLLAGAALRRQALGPYRHKGGADTGTDQRRSAPLSTHSGQVIHHNRLTARRSADMGGDG
jgi:hypothetical protein